MVYLNNTLISTISADKSTGDYFRAEETIEIHEPKEGDEVKVEIAGDVIFHGPLVLD